MAKLRVGTDLQLARGMERNDSRRRCSGHLSCSFYSRVLRCRSGAAVLSWQLQTTFAQTQLRRRQKRAAAKLGKGSEVQPSAPLCRCSLGLRLRSAHALAEQNSERRPRARETERG